MTPGTAVDPAVDRTGSPAPAGDPARSAPVAVGPPPRPVPELGGRFTVADPGAPRPGPVDAPVGPEPARRMPLLVLEPRGAALVARARPVALLVVVLATSLLVGRLVGTPARAVLHNRMLPWILGRSLGIATFLALAATVVLGLWLRHPWRAQFRRPGPESILWAHVALCACTIALLAGHLTSLALDRYAGVGWTGVFVPWGAHFRPTAVAIGTLALYLLLLVAGTAALAGSLGRAVWFPIHTVSVVVFCLCLVHGVLAGSDSVGLRWVYVLCGSVVLLLQFTRWLAGTLEHGPAVIDP